MPATWAGGEGGGAWLGGGSEEVGGGLCNCND